ncbi:hypothetical protein ACS0TY_026000 [Phlomoides rotata]
MPEEGWTMQDGTAWPRNNTRDHPVTRLVYISREKHPGFQHHKKSRSMNVLINLKGLDGLQDKRFTRIRVDFRRRGLQGFQNFPFGWTRVKQLQQGLIKKEVLKSRNREHVQLFEYAVGIHNVGMLRANRGLTGRLFSEELLRVLVCTTTLAWGVNLPAHTVVIKVQVEDGR